ncbi:hypothetical protein ACF0H5_003693 [Mactra antiquata]
MASKSKKVKLITEVKSDMKTADVKDFTQKFAMDDLTLKIEGKSLFVSKWVLSLVSPVFKKMLESDFKEGRSNEIELPGKSYASFYQFLKAIYPCGTDVTEETVFDIFPLAEEYQITNLKVKCVNCMNKIIGDKPSMENMFKILELICMYDMGDVITVDKCLDTMVPKINHVPTLKEFEAQHNIPADVKVRLRDKIITAAFPHGFIMIR